MPSLNRFVDDEISRAYAKARGDFLEDGFADGRTIPAECPFSKREILDLHFFPEHD